MTRAPRSASWRVQNGPAITCSSATTVTPSSGRMSYCLLFRSYSSLPTAAGPGHSLQGFALYAVAQTVAGVFGKHSWLRGRLTKLNEIRRTDHVEKTPLFSGSLPGRAGFRQWAP